MILKNETLSDIATVTVRDYVEGNDWENGKVDVATPGTRPKIVKKGRTYSITLTNNRGKSWDGVRYAVGSGLAFKDGKEVHPTAEAVIHSLLMDTAVGEDFVSFEDFAEDMGYSTDSRKALDIYLACGSVASTMRKLFTVGEFERFNEATEDM